MGVDEVDVELEDEHFLTDTEIFLADEATNKQQSITVRFTRAVADHTGLRHPRSCAAERVLGVSVLNWVPDCLRAHQNALPVDFLAHFRREVQESEAAGSVQQ